MRGRACVPLLAALAGAVGCTSHSTVDLRGGAGSWSGSCLDPNAICTAGADALGDGGPARDASFSSPSSIAFDSTGNLFVADENDDRIRRIDAVSGDVSTVVGDGVYGSPSPGAIATQTHVEKPMSVAVCPDGWLVFLDASDYAIYGVDPQAGTIARLAGDAATNGPAVDDVPASQATFAFSSDLSAVTCGPDDEVLVADTDNHVIRALGRSAATTNVGGVAVAMGRVRVIAGIPGTPDSGPDGPDARASALSYPYQAVSLGDGRVLISEPDEPAMDGRLRLVGAGGAIRTVIGGVGSCCGTSGDGGSAAAASLSYFSGVASDGVRAFVPASQEMRLVDLGTSGSATFAGVTVAAGDVDLVAGNPGIGALDFPYQDGTAGPGQTIGSWTSPPVVSPTGELWWSEPVSGVIRRLVPGGTLAVAAGFAGFTDVTNDFLAAPDALAVAPDGSLRLTAENQFVYRLAPGSTSFKPIAGDGTIDPKPDGVTATATGMLPSGVTVADDGSTFFADAYHRRIRRIDANGKVTTVAGGGTPASGLGDGGPVKDSQLTFPRSPLWSNGILYWQEDARAIRAANLRGSAATIAGVTIAAGNVDTIAGTYSAGHDGDGGPARSAHFYFSDLGSDMAIAAGRLYVADFQELRVIDLATGIVRAVNDGSGDDQDGTLLSKTYIDHTRGLAVHDGWLYWTDDGYRVRRARLPDGPTQTIAGISFGETGDRGPAITAQLEDVGSLAVTPDGVVWVTERGHRVRRIQPGGLP